jgi:hypothetical protein
MYNYVIQPSSIYYGPSALSFKFMHLFSYEPNRKFLSRIALKMRKVRLLGTVFAGYLAA